MRNQKRHYILGFLAIFGWAVLSGCSIQEDIARHDMRLAALESSRVSLERRLDAIEQSGQQQEQTLRSQMAESRAELGRVKTDVAQLRGLIEENQYTLNKRLSDAGAQGSLARIENQLARNLSRLQAIETYLNLEVAEPPAGPGESTAAGDSGGRLDQGDGSGARIPTGPGMPPRRAVRG